MTAYSKSAQAILAFKIARLEHLLTELKQEQHEMREKLSALAMLGKGAQGGNHDDP